MTERRGNFLFLESYAETAEKLPQKYRLAFLNAVIAYGLNGTEPDFESLPSRNMRYVLDIAFTQVRANIEAGQLRYERAVQAGKKGGRPKGNQKLNREETKDNEKVSLSHCHEKAEMSGDAVAHPTGELTLAEAKARLERLGLEAEDD